ncbi:MAG: caspase family protein, partial [Chloroflexus sp.]
MKYALIIGVNQARQDSHLPPLRSAETDAQQLAAALSACGFKITLLVGADATTSRVRDDILAVLSQAKTATNHHDPLDLLVAFCGHGVPVVGPTGEETFLVTNDFKHNVAGMAPEHYLSLRWLYQRVYQSEVPRSVLLMLDCCYAGDIVTVPEKRHQIDLFAVFDTYRQQGRIRVPQDRLRAIFAATSPHQQARETDTGGWMTTTLLPWLRGEQSTDNGLLTAEDVAKALKQAAVTATALQQQPYTLVEGNSSLNLADYRAQRKARQAAAAVERLVQQWRSPETASRIAALTKDFVGRAAELAALDAHIARLHAQGGGYLLVTGVAGQGKSSLLAAWIQRQQELGRPLIPAYFIPFNPSIDEQVALLGHLCAELLMRDQRVAEAAAYLPEAANPIVLRNSLFTLLQQGAACEPLTLVIDGLDQMPRDVRLGQRDLSFLPEQLPPRVVVVIGTRPDDTLVPLRLRTPRVEYRLPALSLDDFAALLARNNVALRATERAQLHTALHGNTFDLAFLAQELRAQPHVDAGTDLIRRVLAHPRDIFTPTLERLQRETRWEEVIRPLLGVLLVAVQPLSAAALGTILAVRPEAIHDALRLLGGLLGERAGHGPPRYYLLHLKVIDYLQHQVVMDAAERREFHRRLAQWCDCNLAQLWEPTEIVEEAERRAYAREHLVFHLAEAQLYERLWAVLEADEYRVAQRQADPSLRGAVRDLDQARAAVLAAAGAERVALLRSLPRLWGYSFLRVLLTGLNEQWPTELFVALVALGRGEEACDRAELLSDPRRRAAVLIAIGRAWQERGNRDAAYDALQRAYVAAAGIADAADRAAILREVAAALAAAGQAGEASAVLEEARAAAAAIAVDWARAAALREVAAALAAAGQAGEASAVWAEARAAAAAIAGADERAAALREVAEALARAGQYEEARAAAAAIADDWKRAAALRAVAEALARAGQYEEARAAAAAIAD